MGGWGKGKGKGPLGGPWGPHHHWHGPGPVGLVAEAAVIGGVTAAVVATAARPRHRRRPPPCRLPPQQVVVIDRPTVAPLPTQVQTSAYMSDGRIIRGKGKGKGKGKGNFVVVQPPPPLDVSSVQLPRDAVEQRGDVTFYAVHVTSRSGAAPWRVMRRYNEFHALHQRMGAISFPDAPFPKKDMFGCKGQKLENRRRGLEVWLFRAIENPASAGMWLTPLREFLEGGRQACATAPSAPVGFAASAPPACPTANDPSLEVNGEEDELADDEDGLLLQIEIPPGVSSGQFLGVTVPDGRQLTVEVPKGMSAGATVELWYNSVDGTLQHVS